MSKKLAIIFPGIGYTVDKPLLYYSRKVLQKNGYEVFDVGYPGLEKDSIFENDNNSFIENGRPANRVSKERLLEFVKKAEAIVADQLKRIDYSDYNRIVFVSKSIGAVEAAIKRIL